MMSVGDWIAVGSLVPLWVFMMELGVEWAKDWREVHEMSREARRRQFDAEWLRVDEIGAQRGLQGRVTGAARQDLLTAGSNSRQK